MSMSVVGFHREPSYSKRVYQLKPTAYAPANYKHSHYMNAIILRTAYELLGPNPILPKPTSTVQLPLKMSSVDGTPGSSKLAGINDSFPKVLMMNVGGRKLMVSTHILREESGLFRHQLSERFTWTPEPDGSYFLDANPALFEHILDFMRRPNIFPLFWSKADGFDYNLYQRLQAEAEYFQIHALEQWIKQKKYMSAINIRVSKPSVFEVDDLAQHIVKNDVDDQWHVAFGTKKIYVCPRGIDQHRGNPDACGLKCHKVRGEDEKEYVDESYIEVVTIRKEILFDESACRA